jgi:hypothetical protein
LSAGTRVALLGHFRAGGRTRRLITMNERFTGTEQYIATDELMMAG